MIEVALNSKLDALGAPLRVVALREPCGADEHLELVGAAGVRTLAERLLAEGSTVGAGDLTLCELDQLCVAVHQWLYGDQIECRAPCMRCDDDFSVGFSLEALWQSLVEQSLACDDELRAKSLESVGSYELSDGTRFRLPTVDDVEEARQLGAEAGLSLLTARCISAASGSEAVMRRVEAAMQCLQPRIETMVDDPCPVCGVALDLRFEIGAFLLAALRRERPILIREIHVLAKAYGWPRAELLSLPRSVRRQHVGLVLADLEGARGWV